MAEMGLMGATIHQSRGWLFNNGRFAENYDQLGACLGSGGMGRVWAARVGETPSSSSSCPGKPNLETSGAAGAKPGSWVAVKAIPMELAEGEQSAKNLQNGLRECLSTFQDLSPVHVVRYDRYWMEEQEFLPLEMRRFWEPSLTLPSPDLPLPALAVAEEEAASEAADSSLRSPRLQRTPSETSSRQVSSRFCAEPDHWPEKASDTGCPRLDRTASGTPRVRGTTPMAWGDSYSAFSDSCGFFFEPNTGAGTSSVLENTPKSAGDAAYSLRKFEAKDGQERQVPPPPERKPPTSSAAKGPTQVVLLIEMELMGAPPGRPENEKADGGERLTLRHWLQRNSGRTFSHAADVFGMLMLSVRHIHRKRLVHADLKPDNIFLVADRSGKVIAVRIGDFGLAGENQLGREYIDGVARKSLPAGGTPGYLAPELLSHASPCSDKADIFACAVILLEVLLPPFRTHMERAEFLEGFRIRNAVPEFFELRLPKTRVLLRDLGAEDPACRLSAEEVCKKFDKEVRKELCRLSIQRCCSPSLLQSSRRHADSGDHDRDGDNKRNAKKGKNKNKQHKGKRRARSNSREN